MRQTIRFGDRRARAWLTPRGALVLAISLVLLACSNDPSGSSADEADAVLSEDAGAVDSGGAQDGGDASEMDGGGDVNMPPAICRLGSTVVNADVRRLTRSLAAPGLSRTATSEYLWMTSEEDPNKEPHSAPPLKDVPRYAPHKVLRGSPADPGAASVFLDDASPGWPVFAQNVDPIFCSALHATAAGAVIGCEHPTAHYGSRIFGLTEDGVWELESRYRPTDAALFMNNQRAGAFSSTGTDFWALLADLGLDAPPGRPVLDSPVLVGRIDPATGAVAQQVALPDTITEAMSHASDAQLVVTSTSIAVAAKAVFGWGPPHLFTLCSRDMDQSVSAAWSCHESEYGAPEDEFGELGPLNWWLAGIAPGRYAMSYEKSREVGESQVAIDLRDATATKLMTTLLGTRQDGDEPFVESVLHETADGLIVYLTFRHKEMPYYSVWRLGEWGQIHWHRERIVRDGYGPAINVDDTGLLFSFGDVTDGFEVRHPPRTRLLRWSPWGHQTCEEAGVCGTMKWSDCDDGNPCTKNLCEPDTGCANPAFEDGTPCGYADGAVRTCAGGVCQL